ncbi:MAG: endospore germination permease [Lutispora sp.]|jgi:spore germination protein (amino acid permease)
MDKINTKHFAFLLLATGIVSLKTYPGVFMRDAGRDSWIAVTVASVLIFAFYIFIISTCKKTEVYNMREIYEKAVGKRLGDIFIALFIVNLFATLIECVSAEANSMHTNMLLETPTWYLMIFFVFPIIYTIRKEIVSIITVTVIGIILIMMAGINLGILTARYKDWSLLFPIFKDGLKFNFFVALAKILGLYGSVSITLPYLIRVRNRKSIIKHVIIALLIIIQMEIVSTTGVITTFGTVLANTMPYPKLIQTQQVSYFRFLEFGELYVMLQILGGWMLKYLISFYAMLSLLKGFGLKRKHLIWITYIVSLAAYISSYFIADNLFRLFTFFNIYSYLSLFNFIIIPLIMFTIFALKQSSSTQN